MENIEEVLAAFKETLMFLVEQEKFRGEEIAALNDKFEKLSSFVMDDIINPTVEAYNQERFDDFSGKYGERLGKFDETLKTSQNDPEYSTVKEAWDELEALPPEERGNVNEEDYVNSVEEALVEYVDNIKKSLGLPTDAAVEIKDDGNGDVEVVADTDGDGEPDTEVTETTTEEAAETPTEEVADESEDEEDEIDPELKKQLEEWSKK